MTSVSEHAVTTVGEEWLASYAAGRLSEAKSLVIACQAAINPGVAARIADMDTIGGALLESAAVTDDSAPLADRILSALDAAPAPRDALAAPRAIGEDGWTPSPLDEFLRQAGIRLKWRFSGPGVWRAPILRYDSGERLYLLKAQGGSAMPVHSHRGEEWTLILQGAYRAGAERFVRGDLHREDESCTHQPVIDPGEPCVCLVAIEGTLRFSQPVLRLLQPMLGV